MTIAGLNVKIDQTAYRAFFMLILFPIVVITIYTVLFRSEELSADTFIEAGLVGLAFVVFHQMGQLFHQLGHALAARATGYPMSGIRFEYIFSYSEYPPNEPTLPARVHIQRSLGGVVGVTLLLIIVILLWIQDGSGASWLFNFLLFDAIILFIGSAVFSDGVFFIRDKGWIQTDPPSNLNDQ